MIKLQDIYTAYLNSKGINTDSRTLKPGEIFIALKGDNFNGNDHVLSAFEKECSYAVADESREEFEGIPNIFIVQNGLECLQKLARHHRQQLKIPIIGLTGSNGKTTSKELLNAAFSMQYKCFATKGNLNNHIGVPLSILSITNDHEIAVIEMGANHQKEIAFLCSICQPDVGYMTNIGLAHLEGFGGEEGVYKGKKELFDYLIENERILFVNMNDPKVIKASRGVKAITYGQSAEAIYQGSYSITGIGLSVIWWRNNDTSTKNFIQTRLEGSYNFDNVLSSIAIARYFGVSSDKIKKGIEAYIPSNNRSQINTTQKGNIVIVDCYNANPSSMAAAIKNVELRENKHKILILGDMLELGDASEEKHLEIATKALSVKDGETYFVGPEFGKIIGNSKHFNTTEHLKIWLKLNPIEEKLILLKGSRKMKLETLLELL